MFILDGSHRNTDRELVAPGEQQARSDELIILLIADYRAGIAAAGHPGEHVNALEHNAVFAAEAGNTNASVRASERPGRDASRPAGLEKGVRARILDALESTEWFVDSIESPLGTYVIGVDPH